MISKHIIVVHNHFISPRERHPLLLRMAETSDTTAHILMDGLKNFCSLTPSKEITFILPKSSQSRFLLKHHDVCYDNNEFTVDDETTDRKDSWIIISNGTRITRVNPSILENLINQSNADLITINVDSALKSNREIVKATSQGEVMGIRQVFFDSLMPDYFPCNWPDHTIIRINALCKILKAGQLPLLFSSFVKMCTSNSLKWQALKMGGSVLDLETEAGFLDFIAMCLDSNGVHANKGTPLCLDQEDSYNNCSIAPSARFYGQVILGKNVQIDDNAIIAGPAVIGNNAIIHSSATVYASIICQGVSVPSNSVIKRRIIDISQSNLLQDNTSGFIAADTAKDNIRCIISLADSADNSNGESFRTWPMLSYARFGKRVIDFTFSLLALLLLAPLFVLIAIIIKIAYPGPVFFKHKREGLHGKEFNCVKFRTMFTGADAIQDKLRIKNEVDGPQFKLEKDPRVTRIGKFLRDTYLDELPQLFNVIRGQMSLIGPRPSPRVENCLCSSWRDARLSVRPGISGLWQISRTRKNSQDFQEWIHFDIEYIRNMSLRQDIIIFIKTIKELFSNFARKCAKLFSAVKKLSLQTTGTND